MTMPRPFDSTVFASWPNVFSVHPSLSQPFLFVPPFCSLNASLCCHLFCLTDLIMIRDLDLDIELLSCTRRAQQLATTSVITSDHQSNSSHLSTSHIHSRMCSPPSIATCFSPTSSLHRLSTIVKGALACRTDIVAFAPGCVALPFALLLRPSRHVGPCPCPPHIIPQHRGRLACQLCPLQKHPRRLSHGSCFLL